MYPTITGDAAEGTPLREPQSCLGPAFAQATYQFFLTGTSTPVNVYQDAALTTPFTPTGYVQADNYGRFPPIYLDPAIGYKVQFYNTNNILSWTVDPYAPPLATTGAPGNGITVAPTGEVTLTGSAGVILTLNAGALGSAPLKVSSFIAGNNAIIINSSATTGAHTATFTATNKPGTATSSPAGWLLIKCDGAQYYTPIWHGNNFEYYTANPAPQGLNIQPVESVTFNGDGTTSQVINPSYGLPANPGNWFIPPQSGVGAGYYINITKTDGLSGLTFSAAQGAWTNIGAGGLTISTNASSLITGTYQMSSSVTGSPVVASGTIQLAELTGVQSNNYIGSTNVVLGGDGTATINGATVNNWFDPTTTNTGSGYWINITRTGGTAGVNFSAAQGAWTNITNAGLTIGTSGGTTGATVTGTYQISSNSAGTAVLGAGTISLTVSGVQSPNWSGSVPLVLAGNGTATLNSASTSAWYSPTTTGVGAGYYIDITRTGGTSGVNFSAAQGSWTNISSSGLTINLTGYTGDVGTSTASGTWKISSSASGSPVLGSGTISLSVSGGTVIHIYTSGSGTEIIPIGTTTVNAEAFGAGSGGGAGTVTGGIPYHGGGGGGGARCLSVKSAASLGGTGKTFSYAVGVGGTNGTNSTITAGTVTGWTAITAGAGTAGSNAVGTSNGAAGPGGTATGGTTTNTNGNAGSGINGGAGITGTISGDGSPYGAGGNGHSGTGAGSPGANGAVVFYYQ